MDADADALNGFAPVGCVVADPLRFKLRLGIGEDAYASLRVKRRLQEIWDVSGMAATGAGVAASPVVASTLFASTASGGFLSLIGLGTAAATPVGWIAAAALTTGGAYYGVTRLVRRYSGACVDTIPKFSNTPMDVLGAALFDLVATLAVRLALVDGHIADAEKDVIVGHFVADWGFDPAFVDTALEVILAGADQQRLKILARAIATFQVGNPDCNPAAMRRELIAFLRDIAAVDGVLDEREELAIEAIDAVLREETELSFRTAGRSLTEWTGKAGTALRGLRGTTPPSAPPRAA